MKIKNENNFTPAPDGVHNGVCVDVVDLGMVDGLYGPKHKLRIVWEIEALMTEGSKVGKRFLVSQMYGASIAKKATLRAHLKSWRGRDFTEEEAKEFDLEKIIGASAQLVIVHNEKDGCVYANVTAVIKAKTAVKPTGDYKRVKDRPGYIAPAQEVTEPARADDMAQKDAEWEADQIPF